MKADFDSNPRQVALMSPPPTVITAIWAGK